MTFTVAFVFQCVALTEFYCILEDSFASYSSLTKASFICSCVDGRKETRWTSCLNYSRYKHKILKYVFIFLWHFCLHHPIYDLNLPCARRVAKTSGSESLLLSKFALEKRRTRVASSSNGNTLSELCGLVVEWHTSESNRKRRWAMTMSAYKYIQQTKLEETVENNFSSPNS